MPKKPKNNDKDPSRDHCQTPFYAVDLLTPYLRETDVVWESAAGEGLLAAALRPRVAEVICTDVLTGQNYFDDRCIPEYYTVQITNMPFSIKYEWLDRAYRLGKPFGLLAPADTLFAATAQELFERYGFGMLLPSQRIDFKMPNTGWKGTAQFTSAWFTWKMGVSQGVNIIRVDWDEDKRRVKRSATAPIERPLRQMKVQQLALFSE